MQHVMNIADPTGHTSISWDENNEGEVELARNAFNDAIKKGYQAFKTRLTGGRGERMTEFDPTAEEMLLVPQLRGG
jgi:hypothetical protein